MNATQITTQILSSTTFSASKINANILQILEKKTIWVITNKCELEKQDMPNIRTLLFFLA